MKAIFLCVVAALAFEANGFSQVQTKPKTETISPVIHSNVITKESAVKSNASNSQSIEKIDSASGILSNASFTVSTANSYRESPGTNKAADTHWSCALFDQNGTQVTSFQDQSNADEYRSGSVTPSLAMHVDKAISFGNFSKGGRLHIEISPKGNDSWVISEFDMKLDFTNPRFSRKLVWTGIELSQDKNSIDVYFNSGQNGTLKYDLKQNKKVR